MSKFFTKTETFEMRPSYLSITFFIFHVTAVLYFNRTEINSDRKILNFTVEFKYDAQEQCVANASFQTFVTIKKLRIYFKVTHPEHPNDKEYKKVSTSTVLDVDKVLKGMQSNLAISAIFSVLKNTMAFKYSMPLLPVSDEILNSLNVKFENLKNRELTG